MLYLVVAIICLMLGLFIGLFLTKSKSVQTQSVLIGKIEQLQTSVAELIKQNEQLSEQFNALHSNSEDQHEMAGAETPPSPLLNLGRHENAAIMGNGSPHVFEIKTNEVRNKRINFPVAINRNLLPPYDSEVIVYIGHDNSNSFTANFIDAANGAVAGGQPRINSVQLLYRFYPLVQNDKTFSLEIISSTEFRIYPNR